MAQQHYGISIHYETWKTGELRRSVKQRHIPLGSRKASRKALNCALRSADESRRPDRFFGLPIELRLQIYEAYCSDCTTEPIFTEATPPLARANRQLRSEFLPVFDKECTFDIPSSRSGSDTLQTQYKLLGSLSAAQLNFVRKRRITWALIMWSSEGGWISDLSISIERGRWIMAVERKKELEALLTSFTHELEQRDPGRNHMQDSELSDLLCVMDEALLPNFLKIYSKSGTQLSFAYRKL